MRKIGILLCLMTAFVLSVHAGGSQEKADEGTVTLTVWDFKYGEEITGAAFKTMDEMFMAENPGIVIEHVAQPESNYYELLLSAFVAESDVDVVLLHADNRAWNLVDYLAVLDDYIRPVMDTYASSALKAVSASGSPDSDIRMLPLTAQGVGFYYNKENFAKAGLDPDKAPVSWDEFLAACEALSGADIDPVVMGNQGSTFGIDFMYRTILATLYGGGIEGFADGTANFTDPEFLTATRMIKTIFERAYVNVENGSIPYFMDAINMFKSGQGGFFCGLTSDIAHWKDFGEALGYENVGYFPAPVSPRASHPERQVNQGTGIALAAVSYSPELEAAKKYISYYTSGDAGKVFMEASGAIVPNSTIPVDSDNRMLTDILERMNNNAAGDFMTKVPGGMVSDFYNFSFLYFIADEMTEENFINRVQKAYEDNLNY